MENPCFLDGTSRYYNTVNDLLVSRIQPGPNTVLDLGCGAGALGIELRRQGRASKLVGVELYGPAAEEAAKVYDSVICSDIEALEMDWSCFFDYVVCGDILEHLRDPWAALRLIRRWLKKEGKILISLPNVRFFRVLFDLCIRGTWDYSPAGVLDQTHLRFFTRATAIRALRTAGFRHVSSSMTIHGVRKSTINAVSLGLFEEFLASQMICTGTKEY